MRLVEKKCPNCGASISFKKSDEVVECNYCHTTFDIEKEGEDYKKLRNDDFILHTRAIRKFSKGFLIVWAVMFIFGLLMFVFIFIKIASKMF